MRRWLLVKARYHASFILTNHQTTLRSQPGNRAAPASRRSRRARYGIRAPRGKFAAAAIENLSVR
jgi:hypothetical protein